jgi:hypothetical protein
MIREDLARQATEDDGHFTIEFGTLESLGFHHEMTHEEMFEINLDMTIIFHFYAIGLGTIVISIVIPTLRILTFNPKEILLSD